VTPTPAGSAEDLVVAGAGGPLAARLYVPVGVAGAGPLLLFFHGGGFVFGDVETHDGMCRLLCAAGGLRVLSVESAGLSLVGDLSSLAPALVVTAGFDPLRDEGEGLSGGHCGGWDLLLGRRYDSLKHGFANMIGLSSASRAALVDRRAGRRDAPNRPHGRRLRGQRRGQRGSRLTSAIRWDHVLASCYGFRRSSERR